MSKLPPVLWSPDMTWLDLRCRCGKCNVHSDCWIQGNLDSVLQRSVLVVEEVERRTGQTQRLWVNSAVRCLAHNADQGGARASTHLSGRALDLKPVACSPAALFEAARKVRGDLSPDDEQRMGGLGLYHTFVHIDVRPYHATKMGPSAPWRRGR